jgi:hypothetical protein
MRLAKKVRIVTGIGSGIGRRGKFFRKLAVGAERNS